MSGKYDARTPAYKRKQTVRATPGSSRTAIHMEYTPNKRSKQDLAVRNIDDEELADALETPSRGDAWKTIQLTKSNKENIVTNSDEIRSNSSDNAAPSSGFKRSGDSLPELSLLAHYDEIIRCYEEYFEDDISEEFLSFAEHQELCRLEWLKSINECKRLQSELEKANHEIGDFSNKLKNARRLLDQEKKLRKRAEEERNSLEKQMCLARDLLFSDKCNRIPDDTREKLAFLNNTSVRSYTSFGNGVATGQRLNTISEVNSHELNSTGSLLSDFSYSRSEDGLDLDVSAIIKPKKDWKRCVPTTTTTTTTTTTEENSAPKKRRSSTHKIVEINPNDKIVATTTLSVSKDGPITATSIIEAVPQDEEILTPSETDFNEGAKPVNDIVEKLWLESQSPRKLKNSASIKRQHAFISKAVIRPDTCGSCNQRIRFGKIALKCKECRGICHMECKNDLPLPCVPIMNTPTQKGVIGVIADYAPTLPPMVPALVVHCINEIELRGLNEVGIYRVPGSEKDVKMMKEKFLRSKSAPSLNEVDIHVICGVVKDFLRSLREPLVTNSLWKDFIQAVEARDIMDIAPSLYQAISQLPQPNRDTLAYIMLHLNKVAESKECKMPAANLAKMFGPTIVGYSSQDIEPHTLLTETRQQVAVMDNLFKIPTDFWASYVNIDPQITTPRSKILLQTPSTESLSRAISGKFFTPTSAKSVQNMRKRRKFFPTPPSKKY